VTTKPTARQVWQQLLDEAGEEQIQAVLSLTPEQVDAELAGFGVDVSKERAKADQFLEDLASGALEARMAEAPLSPFQCRPQSWPPRSRRQPCSPSDVGARGRRWCS